ncbi:PIN domain-containing protein [Microbulbifer sp. SSSA005]|uniref:PIN domain-containing protein n=1 Tax=Microbulbifer sp. SSSA005 TaxID=3243378 RepID=UPI004039BE52
MKKNYVLIDLENIVPNNLSLLRYENFRVIVFAGKTQNKVPLDLAMEMQKIGSRAEYIRISGSGKNSLDFHIAYYLGELSNTEPDAYFHVISKDKGFDPLIKHLREKKRFIQRHVDISDMSILKPLGGSNTLAETDYLKIVNSLKKHGKNRPRKLETLTRKIGELFNPTLDSARINMAIERLKNDKHVVVEKKSIEYSFEG